MFLGGDDGEYGQERDILFFFGSRLWVHFGCNLWWRVINNQVVVELYSARGLREVGDKSEVDRGNKGKY